MDHMHSKHRERMRQRYMTEGAQGFATHELLELFLYYAIPQGDVNATAHALIEDHRSLQGVLNADIDELCTTTGVGPKTAMMLNVAGELLRRCTIENRPQIAVYDSCRKVREFVEPYYVGVKTERVYAILFDNGMRMIDFFSVCEGSINEAFPIARVIARRALLKNASSVVVTHNHPDGFAIATAQDREVTRRLEQSLHLLGISLLEHLLFGGGSCIPLLQTNACMLRTSPTDQDADTFYNRFYEDMYTGERTVAELYGIQQDTGI